MKTFRKGGLVPPTRIFLTSFLVTPRFARLLTMQNQHRIRANGERMVTGDSRWHVRNLPGSPPSVQGSAECHHRRLQSQNNLGKEIIVKRVFPVAGKVIVGVSLEGCVRHHDGRVAVLPEGGMVGQKQRREESGRDLTLDANGTCLRRLPASAMKLPLRGYPPRRLMSGNG